MSVVLFSKSLQPDFSIGSVFHGITDMNAVTKQWPFFYELPVGILIANLIYWIIFRKEFSNLAQRKKHSRRRDDVEVTSEDQSNLVPVWITLVHVLFMVWTVMNAHHPVLFIGGFFIFLGFFEMTPQHQNHLGVRSALLVGFFLAGLVCHGGLQGWWIAPVLGGLSELPLLISSTVLTSFNDNAAITYLSTLVPDFSETLKYAVVAGAVTGGGLTVIANAPNPAGQALLRKFFKNKTVSPVYLALSAMIPTLVMGMCFWFL